MNCETKCRLPKWRPFCPGEDDLNATWTPWWQVNIGHCFRKWIGTTAHYIHVCLALGPAQYCTCMYAFEHPIYASTGPISKWLQMAWRLIGTTPSSPTIMNPQGGCVPRRSLHVYRVTDIKIVAEGWKSVVFLALTGSSYYSNEVLWYQWRISHKQLTAVTDFNITTRRWVVTFISESYSSIP